MRIIDTHVHVLDHYVPVDPASEKGGNWEEGCYRFLLRRMDDCGVEKAVLVPVVAAYSPDNNRECAQLAKEHPDRLALLIDVPLGAPDAATQLARAREESGAVGISYYPPTTALDWMAGPACDPLWRAFKEYDLVCNLQLRPPSYPVLMELARVHPEIRFVCNHLGLPARYFEPDEPRYGGLLEAISLPNITVKASGFFAAANTNWDPRCPRILGFISRLLKDLGPDRVMWGSDWPPSALYLTYRQHLEVVRTFTPDLDERALALVLGENAARVYKI